MDTTDYTKYKCTVSYDGTAYYGWQQQKNVPSVQNEMEEAVEEVFQERPAVYGASRTDSGVHALGQIAHFRVKKKRKPEQVTHALNSYLPEDISVQNTSITHADFQAHIDATGKTYVYLMLNRRIPPALYRKYVHWVAPPLNTEQMHEGVGRLKGTHDFSGFATNADEVKKPDCTMYQATLKTRDAWIKFGITGNRFLYNMVRTIAGTLIEIGKGDRTPDGLERLFESRDRTNAGPVAPAKGLFLTRVYYNPIQKMDLSLENEMDRLAF